MSYQILFTIMVLCLNVFCSFVFFYSSIWAWRHHDSRPWAVILFGFGLIFAYACVAALNGDIRWR